MNKGGKKGVADNKKHRSTLKANPMKPTNHESKDSDPEEANTLFNFIDKTYQANLGKLTAGVSPAAIETAYFSWIAQSSHNLQEP